MVSAQSQAEGWGRPALSELLPNLFGTRFILLSDGAAIRHTMRRILTQGLFPASV